LLYYTLCFANVKFLVCISKKKVCFSCLGRDWHWVVFWVCGGEEWLGIDQKCEFWGEKGAEKYKNSKKQHETVRVRGLF